MVKNSDVKYFEIWYGNRIRIDLVKSIKGIYCNIYTLNKKTEKFIYDSTISDASDTAELILNAVEVLKAKYGPKDVIVKSKFTEDGGKTDT